MGENKKMTDEELEESKILFKRALLTVRVEKLKAILTQYPQALELKHDFMVKTNRQWLEFGGDASELPFPEVESHWGQE